MAFEFRPRTETLSATSKRCRLLSAAPKRRRRKDPKYLDWLHKLPCVVTGYTGDRIQAAHLRAASQEWNKRHTGMAEKSSDRWCLPLRDDIHAEQHAMGEMEFWKDKGIDPHLLCAKIHMAYPDEYAATELIFKARR